MAAIVDVAESIPSARLLTAVASSVASREDVMAVGAAGAMRHAEIVVRRTSQRARSDMSVKRCGPITQPLPRSAARPSSARVIAARKMRSAVSAGRRMRAPMARWLVGTIVARIIVTARQHTPTSVVKCRAAAKAPVGRTRVALARGVAGMVMWIATATVVPAPERGVAILVGN